ncbi:MAG: phospholipase D family protein [Halioglobus sp.]
MNILFVRFPGARVLRCISLTIVIALGLGACVSMPPNDRQVASTALVDTGNTTLGQGVSEAVAANQNKNGVLLLDSGLDAFVARVVLASTAERSLDVQYYLFHRDLSGRLLLDALLKAADRGVRVRLLVDDMDMADTDVGIAVLDAHPNMQVRLFNPFARNRSRLGQYISRFGSVTRRMHNKSFTADNEVTIIGGRNIGDEYFEADPTVAFADMDVMLGGTAAKKVSTSFDLYWNNTLSYSPETLGEPRPSQETIANARENLSNWAEEQSESAYVRALKTSKLSQHINEKNVQFQWADVKIFYDQPEKISASRSEKDLHMSKDIVPYFTNANSEVIIISPYFVPGKTGTKTLCNMQKRGVSVHVLTNSLASTDVSVVHAGYLRYRKKLLQCGVHIYEGNSKLVTRDPDDQSFKIEDDDRKSKLGLSRTSLHAKMFVFDRKHTFIGSLNLDPRSVTENTEIGSVIDSTEIGSEIASGFLEKVPNFTFRVSLDEKGGVRWDGYENGQAVTYTKEPHTSFWERFATQIMRILPIESQI